MTVQEAIKLLNDPAGNAGARALPADPGSRSWHAWAQAREIFRVPPASPAPKPQEVKPPPARYFAPAPEEFRNFKDFARAFEPSLKEAWPVLKGIGWFPQFSTAKEWFDYSWAQPEAEELHASFHS